MDFEELLTPCRGSVERFVRFRIPSRTDAEDVLQEIYLTAFRRRDQLRSPEAFKGWLLAIARSRCSDYFRARNRSEISMEDMPEMSPPVFAQASPVAATLEQLPSRDREVLTLFYLEDLPQAQIAQKLNLALGTVKSRLHTAREHFKANYPYPPKGDNTMSTNLPEYMPVYKIQPIPDSPFPVRCEEVVGWEIVPRPGESLSWGLYEAESGRRTEYTQIQVTGPAEVHGLRGMEFVATQYDAENYYRTGSISQVERRFIAQLTDTHCRLLAESHTEDGVRKCYTFLDGDPFLENWGFGPDNCGTEVQLAPKGLLNRKGNVITGKAQKESPDVVGRYSVTIGGKTFDTICLMDIECFNDAVASEQYIDKNGRTILWRRFNRNDWATDRFGAPWTELFPNNERLMINGQTYVHWYDSLSDYVTGRL